MYYVQGPLNPRYCPAPAQGVAATAQNWLTPCQEGKQGLLQEKSGEVKKMVGRVLRIPNYRSKGIKCGACLVPKILQNFSRFSVTSNLWTHA